MRVILNADDDDNDVFFLQRALRSAGIVNPLLAVPDGQQAKDYLQGRGIFSDRSRYPIPFWLFLDLKLPVMHGLEIVKWIRSQPGLDMLFVVMLSGSEYDREIEESLQAGANAFLHKPPSMDDIHGLEERYQDFVRALGVTPDLVSAV